MEALDVEKLRKLLADEKRAEQRCDAYPSPGTWRELATIQEALNEEMAKQLPALLDRIEKLEVVADLARTAAIASWKAREDDADRGGQVVDRLAFDTLDTALAALETP